MTDQRRPARKPARQAPSQHHQSHPTWKSAGRECPWCGGRDTEHVMRSLASGQESRNQYLRCHDCGRTTYEIVALTGREVRLGRYQAGGEYRDPEQRTRYDIYRMLKIGFDEYLLYLRPVLPE